MASAAMAARIPIGSLLYRNRLQYLCHGCLYQTVNIFIPPSRFQSTCSASITRLKKSTYPRMYKVRLVQPDGSTYTIRYHEPLKLIRLPIDPSTLTEEERKDRLRRLRPEKPKKIYQIEDDDGDFDQRSWTDLIKKKL